LLLGIDGGGADVEEEPCVKMLITIEKDEIT